MEVASVVYAVVLGIIQGITEFLPVSSSAHLIITSWVFNGETLPLSLNVALHIGTLASVLIYFRRDWIAILAGLSRSVMRKDEKLRDQKLFWGLMIGSIPAGLIGLTWKDEIETHFHNPQFIVFPLAIVGVALWLVDTKMKSTLKIKDLGIRESFFIGLAQACALIPGTSRSGSTILGGRLLGLDRDSSARFSFLLGTPAMLGAAALEFKNISASLMDPIFYVGVITSVIVGFLAIHFLLKFLQKFGFGVFAVYRVILAISLFFLVN